MLQLIIVHLMVVTLRNVLYHELLERGGGVAARSIVPSMPTTYDSCTAIVGAYSIFHLRDDLFDCLGTIDSINYASLRFEGDASNLCCLMLNVNTATLVLLILVHQT